MGYFSGRGGNGSFFLSWTAVSPTLHAGVIWKRTKEHSGPEAARKSRSARYEAVGTLARFPHLGRLGRKQGTRELVFRGLPFLLLAVYRVREEVIEIARILYGAQRWPPWPTARRAPHFFSTFPSRKTSGIIDRAPQPAQFPKQN
jgi:toxin ParE1/3/4